jgi:Tetracyclin repressor-like, C-terminal domain
VSPDSELDVLKLPQVWPWLTDPIAFGEQARFIFRRHRWLAGLTMTRPVIGPHGTALIEHFLTLLRGHPAGIGAKMEAFGMLNVITAAFALREQADHPEELAGRYPDLIARVLTGLLGPAQPHRTPGPVRLNQFWVLD